MKAKAKAKSNSKLRAGVRLLCRRSWYTVIYQYSYQKSDHHRPHQPLRLKTHGPKFPAVSKTNQVTTQKWSKFPAVLITYYPKVSNLITYYPKVPYPAVLNFRALVSKEVVLEGGCTGCTDSHCCSELWKSQTQKESYVYVHVPDVRLVYVRLSLTHHVYVRLTTCRYSRNLILSFYLLLGKPDFNIDSWRRR